MDIGSQIPHLHEHRVIRMVYIHFHVGVRFRNPSANFLRKLNGGQGETLVRTLRFHLKGLGTVQILSKIILHGFKNGIQIFVTGAAAAKAYYTENAAAGFPGTVHVRHIVHWLHIDG